MEKSFGQISYEAYAGHTDWKSLVSGAKLPEWKELKDEIKEAWETSGIAVVKDIKTKAGCYICSNPNNRLVKVYDLSNDKHHTQQEIDLSEYTYDIVCDYCIDLSGNYQETHLT